MLWDNVPCKFCFNRHHNAPEPLCNMIHCVMDFDITLIIVGPPMLRLVFLYTQRKKFSSPISIIPCCLIALDVPDY